MVCHSVISGPTEWSVIQSFQAPQSGLSFSHQAPTEWSVIQSSGPIEWSIIQSLGPIEWSNIVKMSTIKDTKIELLRE